MNIYPKISIVTPCLNHVQFIEETLDSIHSQNYPNLEHIVVDGGSTDGSVDIIRGYEDRLTWWCSEPDHGHGDALAKGFAHVTGDIVTWICSDDVLLPGSLEAVAQHFHRHPQCRWLTGNGILISQMGDVQWNVYAISMSIRSMLFWEFWGAPQPSMFFRADVFEQAGGVNPQFHLCPDMDLCLRISRGGPSHVLNAFIGGLRDHKLTQTYLRQEEMSEVVQSLRDREGSENMSAILKRILYSYYHEKYHAYQRYKKLLRLLGGSGPQTGYTPGQHWRQDS